MNSAQPTTTLPTEEHQSHIEPMVFMEDMTRRRNITSRITAEREAPGGMFEKPFWSSWTLLTAQRAMTQEIACALEQSDYEQAEVMLIRCGALIVRFLEQLEKEGRCVSLKLTSQE